MSSETLLRVRGLTKIYERRSWFAGKHAVAPAIHDIGFDLDRGQTLAIAGPSGSGKSTLARCIAGFETPTAGEVLFDGARPQIQLIQQQPAASLNPRFTAAEIVAEPFVIAKQGSSRQRRERAAELMETVGLSPNDLHKRALEFSGGERQRLAIARALAPEPRLLILDESLTGLDWALQSQISGLLVDLQRRFEMAFILIAHDLELAGRLAGEIAVMDMGAIVERGPARRLLDAPRHPRTRELRDAAIALSLDGSI
jgi:ABC-type glutathione transport system ATPase component